MALTEEQIEKLRQEHGEVYEVEGVVSPVAFKKPRVAELEKFTAAADDPKKRLGAARELCSRAVVYPPKDEWNALVGDTGFPLLPMKVAITIVELSSGEAQAAAKKL